MTWHLLDEEAFRRLMQEDQFYRTLLEKNKIKQLKTGFKNMVDGSNGDNTLNKFMKLDLKRCRRFLARMIIIDKLSFRFVEGEGSKPTLN